MNIINKRIPSNCINNLKPIKILGAHYNYSIMNALASLISTFISAIIIITLIMHHKMCYKDSLDIFTGTVAIY